jgi:hypothetical protein
MDMHKGHDTQWFGIGAQICAPVEYTPEGNVRLTDSPSILDVEEEWVYCLTCKLKLNSGWEIV